MNFDYNLMQGTCACLLYGTILYYYYKYVTSRAAKPTNCALCDKSTTFGTDVHMYGTNIFRYWATENLTSVSAILHFKMAAAANRKLAIFLYLSQLQTQINVQTNIFWSKKLSI